MAEVLVTKERPALRAAASSAQGASTVCLVTVSVRMVDEAARPFNVMLYLSDSTLGVGFTAVTASGVVVAGASGVIIGADLIAKKAWNVQTTAAGIFILSITDAAKTPFVVCASIEGRSYPLLTLATASYGP
jgi:hypothetical protein